MRSVPIWVGKTDDAPVPLRVRLRIFGLYEGRCNCCGTKIMPGQKWDLDHLKPLALGGEHAEDNLVPMLCEHHKAKTKQDVALKSKVSRTRAKHIGIKTKKRSFATNRDGRYRKHLDGRVTLRDKDRTPSDGRDTLTKTASDCRPATPLVPSETAGRFFLKTKRLEIVPLTTVWLTHIAALNDRQHMRFSEQRHLVHTRDTQAAYVNSASKSFWPVDLRLRGAELATTVGSMSIYFDRGNKVADIGIMVLPSWTSQGYGKEAWSATMEWLLTEGGMDKVEAGCMSLNIEMLNLCRSTGMDYEGIRVGHFQTDQGFRAGLAMYGKVRQ